MIKVAVIFADGCEEVEGLSVVDVLRRLGVQCDMVGLTSKNVNGDHQIPITCEKVVDDSLLDYDLVAFPGGMTGSGNLRDSAKLEKLMQLRQKSGKWNAAMCAAPRAFAKYGLLKNTDYTCYPGIEEECAQHDTSAHFKEEITVTDNDHKIITSRGPATAWAYSYAIGEALGIDTAKLQEGMLYNYLKKEI